MNKIARGKQLRSIIKNLQTISKRANKCFDDDLYQNRVSSKEHLVRGKNGLIDVIDDFRNALVSLEEWE